MSDETPRDENQAPAPGEAPRARDPLPGDFYMEGPYMVFTATYHLRRGYCCNSNCRHCPYK
jgi:Family of unknown function (DUF5522)